MLENTIDSWACFNIFVSTSVSAIHWFNPLRMRKRINLLTFVTSSPFIINPSCWVGCLNFLWSWFLAELGDCDNVVRQNMCRFVSYEWQCTVPVVRFLECRLELSWRSTSRQCVWVRSRHGDQVVIIFVILFIQYSSMSNKVLHFYILYVQLCTVNVKHL